jgi:hypothetical protein
MPSSGTLFFMFFIRVQPQEEAGHPVRVEAVQVHANQVPGR